MFHFMTSSMISSTDLWLLAKFHDLFHDIRDYFMFFFNISMCHDILQCFMTSDITLWHSVMFYFMTSCHILWLLAFFDHFHHCLMTSRNFLWLPVLLYDYLTILWMWNYSNIVFISSHNGSITRSHLFDMLFRKMIIDDVSNLNLHVVHNSFNDFFHLFYWPKKFSQIIDAG